VAGSDVAARESVAGASPRLPSVLSLIAGLALPVALWLTAGTLNRDPLAVLHAEAPSGWTVVLLFHPEECPSRMVTVDRLNRLNRRHLEIRGIMVVDTAAFTNWRDVVVANQVRFPVRPISPAHAARARHALGDITTPAVLVFDDSGRLRLATDLGDDEWLDAFLRDLETRVLRETLHRTEGPA